jgi:tetratricopeptide (TPR) repeat protein
MRFIEKKGLIGILLSMMVLFAAPSCGLFAAEPALDRADFLYERRYDPANVDELLSILKTEYLKEANNYEVNWRLSRIYWFMADKSTGNNRLMLFKKAQYHAELAVKVDENRIEGHYWLASSYGSISIEKGILNMLFAVPSIRREIERCIEIDPLDAKAHNLYAVFFWKLPAIFGGNLKRAEEEQRLAVNLDKDNSVFWGMLGSILEARGDTTHAIEAFQMVLKLPDRKDDPVENEMFKSEARAALERLKGKK